MKKGVKKMPNHEPVVILAKVLKQEDGKNRHERRKEKSIRRKLTTKVKKI